MPISAAELVRRESLSELRKLGAWFHAKHGTTIVLLGGWAVYSYNPYLGSFDIDCLGPEDPFTRHLNIYMQSHGYVREPESPFGAASESWKKPVYSEGRRIDGIYIDTCDFDYPNYFKEDPMKTLPYSLCTREEYLKRRRIDGEYFHVPTKELLFLYKVKAARDRDHIIQHDPPPPAMLQRIQGKRDKDHSDLAALLDPRFGGAIDGTILGKLVRQHKLEFVADSILNLPRHTSVAEYARLRQTRVAEVQTWVGRMAADSGL
jgi:hypothetical protein